MAIFDKLRWGKKDGQAKKKGVAAFKPKNAEPIKITQNLKGEIETDNIKFNKDLGEEHPFNFSITENLYKEFGLVTAVIDKFVDFVWGAGFFITSEDENAKTIIEQWIEDVNFPGVGRKWLKEALIKGTGFLELGGDEKEVPQGVKVLDAKRMFIRRDKKGVIVGFTQAKNHSGRLEKTTDFEPHRIAHITINEIGDKAYGLGIVYPSLRYIDDLLKNNKDMHQLVSRKANVPIIVRAGTPDEPANQSEVDSIGEALTYFNNKTEWVFSSDVEVSTLNFGKVGENFDSVLKHDIDMLIFSFQVPEVLLGRGSIPEGLAKVQMDAFERRAKSLQTEIEKVIEKKIFKRILRANGIDANVQFNWGQPSKEDTNARILQITTILQNPAINPLLRKELEFELAELFGIKKDKIELPEEERETEETQRTQPVVPGSNQQSYYEAKIINI